MPNPSSPTHEESAPVTPRLPRVDPGEWWRPCGCSYTRQPDGTWLLRRCAVDGLD